MTKARVFKQTHDTGLLNEHWDRRFAYDKVAIILGIRNTATCEWLNGNSGPTSGGADVYNFHYGSTGDQSMTVPVRYDLLRQGNAMIVRCSRYKTTTVPHPVGFVVNKFVIWFNAESMNF